MLKNITGTLSVLLEGVESLTQKTVDISLDTLDLVGEEISISLEATVESRGDKLKIAKAELAYDLKKANLKLAAKLSALQKLADKQSRTTN